MRNIDDISDEEFKERTKLYQNLLNEPYNKYLKKIQNELFHNPNCKEWKTDDVNLKTTFGLKKECQNQWDLINDELNLFKKNVYPELSFELEDDDNQNLVLNLKQNEQYKRLIFGINYFSESLDLDEDANEDIAKLNSDITILIQTDFPILFTLLNDNK